MNTKKCAILIVCRIYWSFLLMDSNSGGRCISREVFLTIAKSIEFIHISHRCSVNKFLKSKKHKDIVLSGILHCIVDFINNHFEVNTAKAKRTAKWCSRSAFIDKWSKNVKRRGRTKNDSRIGELPTGPVFFFFSSLFLQFIFKRSSLSK